MVPADHRAAGAVAAQDVLQHYGIKGQKWGLRRKNPSGGSSGPEPVTVKVKGGKGIVKTKGGGGQLPSEDAVNAAAYKQKAKSSSVAALDNKELQALVQRMNLEQQYAKLTAEPSRADKGQKFIKSVLAVGKTANDVYAFANSPAGKLLQAQMKGAGVPTPKGPKVKPYKSSMQKVKAIKP